MSHRRPYYKIKHEMQLMQAIVNGKLPSRPSPPRGSNPVDNRIDEYMWKICTRCWARAPEDRPSMAELHGELSDIVGTCDFIARMMKMQVRFCLTLIARQFV